MRETPKSSHHQQVHQCFIDIPNVEPVIQRMKTEFDLLYIFVIHNMIHILLHKVYQWIHCFDSDKLQKD